jgi:ParB/RepB/Spo0J family partition protein
MSITKKPSGRRPRSMKSDFANKLQPLLFDIDSLSPPDSLKKSDPESSHAPMQQQRFQAGKLYHVKCSSILKNPQHVRKFISKDTLRELSESIKSKGLLQPLICTVTDGKLQLACGYRRLAAAKMAGLEEVPVMVINGTPNELSLIENLHRDNLTVVEEAEGVYEFQQAFDYTQEKLSKLLCKAISTISEILAVAIRLPLVIRDDCRCNPDMPRDVLVKISRAESDEEKIWLYKKYKARLLTRDDLKKLSRRSNSGTREVFAFIVSFLEKLARFNPDKIGPSNIDRFVKELERAYVELEKLLGVLNKQH